MPPPRSVVAAVAVLKAIVLSITANVPKFAMPPPSFSVAAPAVAVVASDQVVAERQGTEIIDPGGAGEPAGDRQVVDFGRDARVDTEITLLSPAPLTVICCEPSPES